MPKKYPPHLLAPIGVLDPDGLMPNPLTGEDYQNLYVDDPKVGRTYSENSKYWRNLGVLKRSTELLKLIHDNQVIIAMSGTGTGKTVIFPKLALHAVGYNNRVICTIPKQVPAKGAGEWAAICMDVRVGEEVGYRFKGNVLINQNGRESKLVFCTAGTLEAIMIGNPLLDDDSAGGKFDCVLIDEAHERTTANDTLLQNVRYMCERRPDVKVIVMSATIDLEWYARYFEGLKVDTVYVPAPPTFPRILKYPSQPLPKLDNKIVEDAVVDILVKILEKPPLLHDPNLRKEIIKELLDKKTVNTKAEAEKEIADGDIIVFMGSVTGAAKLFEKLYARTDKLPNKPSFFCTKLESRSQKNPIRDRKGNVVPIIDKEGNVLIEGLTKKDDEGNRVPLSEQEIATMADNYQHHPDRDPKKPYERKVIFSTNVAESSVTFSGKLTYVVETGVALMSKYLPKRMESSLMPGFIAQGPIQQREGRTGRTCPGVVYHLYTKAQYDSFKPFPDPEMLLTDDLPSRILRIMSIEDHDSVRAVHEYFNRLPDAPTAISQLSAFRILVSLGAIRPSGPNNRWQPEDKRTFLGRAMSFLLSPLTPYQAKALIASFYYKCLREMSELCALVEILSGKGIEALLIDSKRKWKNRTVGIHPDLVSFGTTQYGDHITLLRTYTRYRKATDKKTFCKKHNVQHELLSKVDASARKYQMTVENLLERTDTLMIMNEDEIITEETMGGVGRYPGQSGERVPDDKTPVVESGTPAKKAHGGGFEVNKNLSGVFDVNISGSRDLAVLYTLYPECNRSIRQILLTITRETRHEKIQSELAALYALPGSAREALSRSIRSLPQRRFYQLGESEQKKVLQAYASSIAYRKKEMKRYEKAKEVGKTPPVVGDELDSKGHAHWLKELEMSYEKAKILHKQKSMGVRSERRKRVKEELRPFFTELPDNFYEPVWANVEMRLMRAMIEGYFVNTALRIGEPKQKKYAVPFPMEHSIATLSENSILGKNYASTMSAPLCVFEKLFSRMEGKHELVLVTAFPREIWQSRVVRTEFIDSLALVLPEAERKKLTLKNGSRRRIRRTHRNRARSHRKQPKKSRRIAK